MPSRVPRKDPKAHAVNNHLGVFGSDVVAFVFPGSSARRGNGNEFDFGRVFAETTQGSAGMEPGGDNDNAFAFVLAQHFDREERILLCARGLAFEFDDIRRDAELLQ